MKKIILIWMAALMAGAVAQAAQLSTYQKGLERAGEDKVFIVFCYGANYDKYSERIYQDYIKNKRNPLARLLSREPYVVVPIYQQPTPSEKREYEKVMGKSRLPGGIWSYPSLTLVDGKGNFRGSVQSSEELATPEKAAEALSTLLEDYRMQQKLLAHAERLKGDSRAQVMREALSFSRVPVPGHGSYDPANNGLVEKLQLMSIEQANEHVRKIIAGGSFTRVERQMILVALAGHMRRNKAAVHRLRAIFTEIRNIDPTSVYGAYAQGALELWVIPRETEIPEEMAGD